MKRIALLPMPPEKYPDLVKLLLDVYSHDLFLTGAFKGHAEAIEYTRTAINGGIPDGRTLAKDHYLFEIICDETQAVIGHLWCYLREKNETKQGYICSLFIDIPYRHQGYAKPALHCIEEFFKEMGVATVALHVIEHNAHAKHLYIQQGYVFESLNKIGDIITGIYLEKDLSNL